MKIPKKYITQTIDNKYQIISNGIPISNYLESLEETLNLIPLKERNNILIWNSKKAKYENVPN